MRYFPVGPKFIRHIEGTWDNLKPYGKALTSHYDHCSAYCHFCQQRKMFGQYLVIFGRILDFSRSRDVIDDVTIRFPIGHFLFAS